jgi:oligoendopeptidase F
MIDPKHIKTQWDLTQILSDDSQETISRKITEATKLCFDFETTHGSKTDTFTDPQKLKNALDALENILLTTGDDGGVGSYFSLKSSLDESDPKIKAQLSKIEDATRESSLIFQRFVNKLSKIPSEKQPILLSAPELSEYKRLLESCFETGKYLLSEETEKALMLTNNVSYGNWVQMVSEFLSTEEAEVLNKKGEKETKNFSELFTLIAEPKKEIRDIAASAINKILEKHAKSAEAELNSVLEYKKVKDLLRGYETPDSSFSIGNEVSLPVINTLISVVTENFDIVHKFYALRAKLLGMEKINYYERSIDYGNLEKDTTFEEAVTTVSEVLTKLDPEFNKIFESFLYNGQVDVYPKKGKSHGAFMRPLGKNKPSFVLLNFDNKLQDVFTLAHEFGHAIHHELANENQKIYYTDPSLCLDETASTFMEGFVVDSVTKNLDDESRLTLLIKELDEAVGTVFRQLACYKFERSLHHDYREKGFLSKEEIGELFTKHMSEYCGPSVVMNAGSENWWVYWSHIRNFFYVFSYAFGHLVSNSLQSLVREDPKNITKVKKLLEAGGFLKPEDALKEVGIDINNKEFWEKGISQIRVLLDEATSLAKTLGKV